MVHILYRITYLPHVKNNTPPFYYIGSKYNYDGVYMGSPSSKQSDWYTKGLSIAKWWKTQVKNNPQDFKFEVLSEHESVTPQDLVEQESGLHIKYDVKDSEEYFNKAIATCGWVSAPRTDATKNKVRKITEEYWQQDSDIVRDRKKKIVEYNKKNSADKIRKAMKENPEAFEMTDERKEYLSIKVSENWKNGVYDNRKPRKERKVVVEGIEYASAKEAAKKYNVHPVTVRRKCCDEKYDQWRYL